LDGIQPETLAGIAQGSRPPKETNDVTADSSAGQPASSLPPDLAEHAALQV